MAAFPDNSIETSSKPIHGGLLIASQKTKEWSEQLERQLSHFIPARMHLGSVLQMFSEPETEYMKTQRLCRFATVEADGQPDVVPVGFEFDGKYFYVGSHSQDIFFRTRKYHNVKNGRKNVALTIDDLESVDPWRPRAIRVYGTAEIVDHKGIFGPGKYLQITPRVSWSFGIKGLKLPAGKWSLKTVH